MSQGKHSNHIKSSEHYKWNNGKILSSHGYKKVRVGVNHPLADPNGYAYEHLLVWVSAGNSVPKINQILHHKNERKTDNRIENLEVLNREEHPQKHQRMVSNSVVRSIRERYAKGEDGTALADEYNIPHQRVYRYLRGESRRGAGGPIFKCNLRKKHAGRLLDGREWNEMPEVSR